MSQTNSKRRDHPYTKLISYKTLVGLFFLANFMACDACSNKSGKSGAGNPGGTVANTSNNGGGGASNGGSNGNGGTSGTGIQEEHHHPLPPIPQKLLRMR